MNDGVGDAAARSLVLSLTDSIFNVNSLSVLGTSGYRDDAEMQNGIKLFFTIPMNFIPKFIIILGIPC